MNNFIITLNTFLLLVLVQGCSKLEYTPTDLVPSGDAINNLASAQTALIGIYNEMQDQNDVLLFDGYIGMAGLYSDELDFTGTFPSRQEADNYDIFSSNTTMSRLFSDFYDAINAANNVIKKVSELDLDGGEQIVAEARFLRAFCYMYLVNYFGETPLVTEPTTKADESIEVPKNSVDQIWIQIIDDLKYAGTNLNDVSGARAGKYTAAAYLAKAYLYTENYSESLKEIETVIAQSGKSLAHTYQSIFDGSNETEHLFSLGFSEVDKNQNAYFFYPGPLGGRLSAVPSSKLKTAYEANDERKSVSIDTLIVATETDTTVYVYGNKYTDVSTGTDPIYLLRYAEVLLIAAEAAAREKNYTAASGYLNQVRNRAGLGDKTLNEQNYIDEILQERFVELAMEGPHRFFMAK